MGTILATPIRSSKGDSSGLKETNNNTTSNLHSSKSNLNFSKFSFVHDCLPNLSGKENKLFQEKVSSHWFRSKNDTKKKGKAANTSECNKKIDSTSKPYLQNKQNILEEETRSEKIQRTTRNETQIVKLHSASQPDLVKGYLNSSLSETLKYIGCFVYLRCRHVDGLKPSVVVSWIKGVDRSLIFSGWQEHGFISQPNMIVLYMLLREVVTSNIETLSQLKATVMSSLYMCYSYNGHEISYPLKPFLTDGDRTAFWNRCMVIINNHSGKMLKINKDAQYFNEIQTELKNFGRSIERKDG